MVTEAGSKSALYQTWKGMHRRCSEPTDSGYKNYGGRGISVCKRWSSLILFIEDMGPRPKGCSIDRIDNDGDYCPENCRWSTAKRQSRNKRNTVMVNYGGRRMTLIDAAEIAGASYDLVYDRVVYRGASIDDAINGPTWGMESKKRKDSGMSFNCEKCGHTWLSRTDKPKACPCCKRYDWAKKLKKSKGVTR